MESTLFYPRKTFLILGVSLLSILSPHEVLAWGASGHRMIGELAIKSLPSSLPEFIRSPKAVTMIGELAREPDRSKGTGNSHDHDLDPGHFINLSDEFRVADSVSIDPLPESREDYDTALRQKGNDEYKVGFLPYSIIDGWQQLQRDFAYWRADRKGESLARSKAERQWFKQDRLLHELIILRDLGYWSHFVGDASQPMHVSIHYDAWGDYPNPENFNQMKGFHSRFEGSFISDHVRPEAVLAKLKPVNPCDCTIQSRTVTYLKETQAQVIPLFRLESEGAFSFDPDKGKAFAVERLAAAVSELRDMILEAWNSSEDSTVGYPPVKVQDIESGLIDPIENMKGLD